MPTRHTPPAVAGLPRSRSPRAVVLVGLGVCYLATVVLLLPPSLDPRPVERIATTVTALLTAAAGAGVMVHLAQRWALSPAHAASLVAGAAGTVLACLQLTGPDSGSPQGLGPLAVAVLGVSAAVALAPSSPGARHPGLG